ncbi:MATE family efflux transporter [Kordiimonas lacus]|uniref:Multidrug resistance protein, MATE family n=1 Tax=Kordiimonas lacus TaxID=637679 RepID=A0A1G6TQR3_9PROT|nr:MATE family efflux transporter [Kordiimonas lacus]SDD31391.1 multidrug resistance protein, MATE family [Kordiimonas lacus]
MTKPVLAHPHRRIWAIAGPAIIANSSAPLVGLVDTWIIGHLPAAKYLAAVSVGSLLFSYVYWACGFLRMSTTGLVAQAHGRDDQDQVARVLLRATMLAALLGLLFLALSTPFRVAALGFLDPPADVIPLFDTYFDIRAWAIPAALLGLGINGFLIGTARAKLSLYVQLTLNIANAVLSLLFVLGFDMGVAGVALGSLIAEWLAVALGFAFISRTLGLKALAAAVRESETYNPAKMKKLMSVNGFIFVRTLLLIFAFALLTREAAALGGVALAAHHVLNTFMMLIALGLDGFAYASEALAGAAYGKGVRHEFRGWVKYGMIWSGAMAILYALGFYLGGASLIFALTDLESVRAAATEVIPVIVLLPLVGAWCYQYDGIYIGATAGRAMFGTIAVSVAVFVPSIGPLADAYGLVGLWMAMMVFLAMRGLTQAIWYPRLERRLATDKTEGAS